MPPLEPPASPLDAEALLEAAPCALLHVGADGQVLRSNASARALCGPAATPGQPLSRVFEASEALRLPSAQPVLLKLLGAQQAPVEARTQALPGGGWMLWLQAARALPPQNHADTGAALELAVELGHIAVWRHDLASGRVFYNAQAHHVLDVPSRPDGLPLDEARSHIHPEDRLRVEAAAERALQVGGATDIEARYRRREGGWRQVMTRRVLQRDARGQPVAFIGVALDVGARHEQRRHAEEMKRRFELATEAAGIGYWVLEPGERRPRWNRPLRAVHGLDPQSPVPSLSHFFRHGVHPEDRASVRQRFLAWRRSGLPSLDLPLRALRRDGSVRHLSTHTRVEGDGPGSVMFGVVIDLTERRSAEQALRTAEQSVALAARGAGLGTWQLELESGRAFWDPQMWLLRGHTPQARAMTDLERMNCVHPDDRDALYGELDRALAEGLPFENEFRVVWPDGQLRWLASRSVEVLEGEPPARRRIGVNWDVTDKRNAEASRREREVAQRESQAKSRFLARMSHELRTPLNAVLGFSQLLLAAELGSSEASVSRRQQLQHIRAAGQHLLALVNDVLDLSSLQSGEMPIVLQALELAPQLEQTLPMLGGLLAQHKLSLRLGRLDGRVMADPTRLRQALLNLLSNAVKYNREGGSVGVETQVLETTTVLRVSDSGCGLDPRQLDQLFEPFNRLGRGSEGPDGVEGSGIGLAIVKALVEGMGGSVQVRSTPGVGSVFELHLASAAVPPAAAALPVASAAATEVGAPPSPPATVATSAARAPARSGRSLLYIEDNPVNALLVSELVARRGDLQLHLAEDGLSGVRQALAVQPDLVLLDMQLPDIDGHEVLRRLRQQPALDGVPVIALSANAMPEDIQAALAAGMSDYWTKPLDFKAFMASLDSLFGPPPA